MMKEFSIIHNYRADRQEDLFTFLIGKQSSINFMHYYLNGKLDVFVDGYIVNETLQNSRQSEKNHCSQLIEKVIAIINSGKIEDLGKINGHYNIIICDRKQNKINVVTDRYGMRPLFWYRNSNITIISNSVIAICKHGQFDNQIDFSAIANFIKFEWVTNNATFFKNIVRFSAGTINIFTKNGLEVKPYYIWPAVIPRNNLSVEENAEQVFGLLDKAVSRVLIGVSSPGITISGGLDSRIITGFINRKGVRPLLYHCLLNNYEKLGAQGVADAYHVDLNTEEPLKLKYNINDLPILYGDGCTSVNQFWLNNLYKKIYNDKVADCIFDGFNLDLLLNLYGFVIYDYKPKNVNNRDVIVDADKKNIANMIYGLPKGYLEKYFNKSKIPNINDTALNNVEKLCSSIKNNDIVHFCRILYLMTRGKRYVYMMSYINQHYCDMRFPGLDYNLIDYCMQLPPHYFLRPLVYLKIFEKYFLDLYEVVWNKTGMPLNRGFKFPKKYSEYLTEIKYMLRRATLGKIDLESSRNDYNRLFRNNKKFRYAVMHLFQDGECIKNGIIGAEGFERLCNDIYYGRNDFAIIERLIAIELFFRFFVLRANNETSTESFEHYRNL